MTVRILVGDVRARLKELADESVQCVITSPPYFGLRKYLPAGHPDEASEIGLEDTPAAYIKTMVEVFREVRRVLRTDGTLWLNIGDSYAGSWGAQSRGDEYPGTLEGGSMLSARQIAAHPKRTNTGSIRQPGLKPKDLIGIPWRLAFALQDDGWWLRQDIIWSKKNCLPESVRDRCTKSHEYLFLLTKSDRYFFDQEAISEESSPNTHARLAQDVENQAGTTRTNGGSRADRPLRAQLPKFGGAKYGDSDDEAHRTKSGNEYQPTGRRNKRSVWTIAAEPFRAAHFATMPTKLVEPAVLAGTSAHGCCPACGAPWERDTEQRADWRDDAHDAEQRYGAVNRKARSNSGGMSRSAFATVGWRPGCICGAPDGVRAGDLEVIESPTAEDDDQERDDPSLEVGRAGMARPRRPDEGTRPMTRYEHRQYAIQMRASKHREAMATIVGTEAHAHYERTDKAGARPVPPKLLEEWIELGWLRRADPLPAWSPPRAVPCTVLDPFFGAGTVGVVASRHHRKCVGIELNSEYALMADRRIRHEAPLLADVVLIGDIPPPCDTPGKDRAGSTERSPPRATKNHGTA